MWRKNQLRGKGWRSGRLLCWALVRDRSIFGSVRTGSRSWARYGGWIGALSLTATVLLLLPLTVVGIARLRIASYLLFGSVGLTLLGALYTVGVPTLPGNWFQFYFLLAPILAIPTVVAALLLYSVGLQKHHA